MNRLTPRVWFTAILMTVGWLSTVWVRTAYTIEVQPLAHDLGYIPFELEGYLGTDVPLDEQVRKILNADATLNRNYQHPNGSTMVLHISAWVRPEFVGAPHNPKICYTNAGWKILEERDVEASTPTRKLPLHMLLLERGGERLVLAFWFRMGQSIFNNENGAKQARSQLWGRREQPPTIKVLLQTPAESIEAALPQIERFAPSVFQYTGQL